jgi:hypothetical protein
VAVSTAPRYGRAGWPNASRLLTRASYPVGIHLAMIQSYQSFCVDRYRTDCVFLYLVSIFRIPNELKQASEQASSIAEAHATANATAGGLPKTVSYLLSRNLGLQVAAIIFYPVLHMRLCSGKCLAADSSLRCR